MAILLYDLVGADPARPFSPHCWKVKLALAHKGLAFETVPTPFTKVPEVEAGFSKLIPVIRNGETLVADSFEIALYLEATYPGRPTLFAGEGGQATARFIERWSQLTIHPYVGAAVLVDIHDRLAPADQAYFRASREKRNNGKPLEEVASERDARHGEFLKRLEPLRSMLTYQPFIGGAGPLFSDYIVAGAFQWTRVTSPFEVLPAGDPVHDWFGRCLDLYDGLARRVPAAA